MTLTRRTCLTAAVSSLCSRAQPAPPRDRILCQTYIWILTAQLKGQDLPAVLPEVAAATAQAGFQQVELMSAFLRPESIPATMRVLRDSALTPTVIYHSAPVYDRSAHPAALAEIDRLARTGRDYGMQAFDFSLGAKPGKAPVTDDEIAAEVAFLQQAGECFQALSVPWMLHHHEEEMQRGALHWRALLRQTAADRLSLCLDIDWILVARQDPAAMIGLAGSRLRSIHFRCRRAGVWLESLSGGDFDLALLVAPLNRIRYRGYLGVELAYDSSTNMTRSLTANLAESRQLLERLFLRPSKPSP